MKINKLILGITLFSSSYLYAGMLRLPDSAVDTADEVYAINHNFEELYRGKLDIGSASGVAGSNTQVQFNDSGDAGASSLFTFNKNTGNVMASTFTATYVAASTVAFTNLGGTGEAQLQWRTTSAPGGIIGFGWNNGNVGIGYYDNGTNYSVHRNESLIAINTSGTPSHCNFALGVLNTGMYGDSTHIGFGINSKAILAMDNTKITISSHTEFTGGVPVISLCGAVPNGSVVGNDKAGIITVGGGVTTACTLTFNASWSNIAICTATDDSSAVTVAITTASASAVTFGFGATLGNGKVYYHCFSYN